MCKVYLKMSEEEILNNDLRDIFELVRVHQEFNKAINESGKNEEIDYVTEEKYIDDIII